MKQLFKPAAIVIFSVIAIILLALKSPEKKPPKDAVAAVVTNTTPRIQAAILLDVSNSMDGLIEQAKAQLWNMVSVMGKAKCNNVTPDIEIALYEYGRTTNDVNKGYVKQISGFTSDLDQLSQKLFGLTTDGGDEYCGQVIYTSLKDLKWDSASADYKVVFIAGNEDFLQGNVLYTKACDEAKKKGVIINTIYCGDRMQGIREHWNLNTECGSGSFTNINQDAKIEDMPTPYDSLMFTLNDKLNQTYLTFGAAGASSYAAQGNVDQLNYSANKTAAIKRVEVKSKKDLYKNTTWDMVDAADKDEKFAEKVDLKTLPDSMKNKTRKEIKQIIDTKSAEREQVQKDIESVSEKRRAYIAEEKKKAATSNQASTLESEIERIIKTQAVRFRMVIK